LSPPSATVSICHTADCGDPALHSAYRQLLSPRERQRADRFHFTADRLAFQAAHALLRCSLSRACPGAPGDWTLSYDERGRPRSDAACAFSISHTRQVVACLVAPAGRVGVDVERCGRVRDPLALARSRFAPEEIRQLEALPAQRCDAHFTLLWTLKEALAKALGLGLDLPLDELVFLREGQRLRTRFGPSLADENPAHWHFASFFLGDGFFLSTAMDLRSPPPRLLRTVPLKGAATWPAREKPNLRAAT